MSLRPCSVCHGEGWLGDQARGTKNLCLTCVGSGEIDDNDLASKPATGRCWFCDDRLEPGEPATHAIVLRFGGLWVMDAVACDICLKNTQELVKGILESFRVNIRKAPSPEPQGRNIVL